MMMLIFVIRIKKSSFESNEEMLNFVFNHKTFDSRKSNNQDSFVDAYKNMGSFKLNKISFIDEENVVTVMNKIFDYNKEHNHLIDFSKLLPDGKSFFTSISNDFSNIDKVLDFLLDYWRKTFQ